MRKSDKPSLYISYPSQDLKHPLFLSLVNDLRHHADLLSYRNPETGEVILNGFVKLIQETDYMIHIWSKNTAQIWCDKNAEIKGMKFELFVAFANQLVSQSCKIIPVCIDDVPIPSHLKYHTWIDLVGSYKDGLASICSRILKTSDDLLGEFPLDQQFENTNIIQIANTVDAKLIEYFSNHPRELQTMNRRLFEELVAELFKGFGFSVELTQKTRDGGIDIIAVKHDLVKVKYLIECKRPEPGNPIGVAPVRALYGVTSHERATKGILATTSYFTKDAQLIFNEHPWELEPIAYDGIIDWMAQYLKMSSVGAVK